MLSSNVRRWLTLGLITSLLAVGGAPASAQSGAEPIHVTIEAVDPATGHIRADGKDYKLSSGGVVQWSSGQRADLSVIMPGMRATLELVSGTASNDVPLIKTLTLPLV